MNDTILHIYSDYIPSTIEHSPQVATRALPDTISTAIGVAWVALARLLASSHI